MLKRFTLGFSMVFIFCAIILAGYGTYLLVRSPEAEASVFEFISEVVDKTLRFLIKP